jgi:sugar lactone lactonase YvrE
MRAQRWFFRLTLAAGTIASLAACGDDETQTTTSSTTSGTGTGTGGSGGGTTTGTGGATTTGTGGSGGVGGAGGSGGSGGTAPNCENLPVGPIEAVEVLDVFNGSEDLAFDGKGHIVAKNGNAIILSDAAGQTTDLADVNGTVYGVRYRPDGFLVAARPGQGVVVEISPQGMVTDYVTGLNNPNGLYPDFEGNVWMTEFGGGNVSRINPGGSVDVIVANAASPNGVVFDATRTMLFYTEYGDGQIFRVDMSPGGDPTPIEVAQINGALDGLVLDACGNIYAVDNGNSDLYRVKLDAAGAAIGAAELLASFPQNVANAQFGSGAGFDPMTLYAAGNPGTVYGVAVGVAGAPVPTPP